MGESIQARAAPVRIQPRSATNAARDASGSGLSWRYSSCSMPNRIVAPSPSAPHKRSGSSNRRKWTAEVLSSVVRSRILVGHGVDALSPDLHPYLVLYSAELAEHAPPFVRILVLQHERGLEVGAVGGSAGCRRQAPPRSPRLRRCAPPAAFPGSGTEWSAGPRSTTWHWEPIRTCLRRLWASTRARNSTRSSWYRSRLKRSARVSLSMAQIPYALRSSDIGATGTEPSPSVFAM